MAVNDSKKRPQINSIEGSCGDTQTERVEESGQNTIQGGKTYMAVFLFWQTVKWSRATKSETWARRQHTKIRSWIS
jgi:hypothetical protein